MSKNAPDIDVSMGSFQSNGREMTLEVQFRNIGNVATHITRFVLVGEEVSVPSKGIMPGETLNVPISVVGMSVVNDKNDDPRLRIEYKDGGGAMHVTHARVIRKLRADGRFRVEGFSGIEKEIPGEGKSLSPSETKRGLANELAQLHKALNVPRLYEKPDHRETKDWLADVSAVLKQLDEGDYKAFMALREKIYENVPLEERKEAVQRIDTFTREKKAAYLRYDWSGLDKQKEKPSDTKISIGSIGSVGQWNQGGQQTVTTGDVLSGGSSKKGGDDSHWLSKAVISAIIVAIIGLVFAYIKGWLGIE